MNEKRIPTAGCGNKVCQSAWVVNLSDRKLTAAEEAILQKGPKYATTPRINPIDFAAPIESALSYSKVSDQVKETTRIKICEVIRKAKRPQSNVSKEERQAWRTLQEDTTI